MSPSSASSVVCSRRSTRENASEAAITIHCDGKLVVYVILKCDEARDKVCVLVSLLPAGRVHDVLLNHNLCLTHSSVNKLSIGKLEVFLSSALLSLF